MSIPERIRYHLDENCDPTIAYGLRRRGIDVTTSQEAKLLGKVDPDQLVYAREARRVLMTHDGDFLRINSRGVSHSGIIYSRQYRYSIGEIIDKLSLIFEVCEAAEMQDHLEYL